MMQIRMPFSGTILSETGPHFWVGAGPKTISESGRLKNHQFWVYTYIRFAHPTRTRLVLTNTRKIVFVE